MARNCILGSDGIDILERKVAGDLKRKRITSVKFDLLSYAGEVYQELLKITKDPVNSYTYAQLVPHSVYIALLADGGMLKYYTSKRKLSMDKLIALSDRWLGDIDSVIEDLGFKLSTKDLEKLDNIRKRAGIAPNRNTPNPMDLGADLFSQLFSAKKASWFSTTSNETIVRTPAELVADGTSKNIKEAIAKYSDERYKYTEGERGRINPNMALQFDFIRGVLKQFAEDVKLKNDSRNIKSVAPNGFSLTVMSNKRIPEDQIDDNTKRWLSVGEEGVDKKYNKLEFEKMLSFVVTNDKGEPLYFKIDKTKKLSKQITPSNKKEGKMIYYTLNQVKYNKQTGAVNYEEANLQTPEQVVDGLILRRIVDKKNKLTAIDAVKKQYAEQEASLKLVTDYIAKDPINNQVRSYAIGGSHGSIANQRIRGIKGRTDLTKFNLSTQKVTWEVVSESEGKGETIVKNPLNGTTFIKTDTMPMGVPVLSHGIQTDTAEGAESSEASMIASFLVDDIYQDGKKLTDGIKYKMISPFVRVANKGFYIDVREGGLQITVGASVLKTDSEKEKKKAKEAIFKYFSTPYINENEATKKGPEARALAGKMWRIFKTDDPNIHEAVEGDLLERVYKRKGQPSESVFHRIHKRIWNINKNAIEANTELEDFTNFKLTPGKKGVINLEYHDPAKIRVKYRDWVISKSYVFAKPNIDGHLAALNGYFNIQFEEEDLDIAKGKKKVDKKKAKQDAKDAVKERNKTPIKDGVADQNVLKELEGFEKTGIQKKLNVSVTQEQLDTAEKWWPTHPMSKSIPFRVAFNIANTKRPGSVAEWTTSGGILLSKGSDYTDVYHEAWHAFSQMFLTQEQRFKLYEETRNLAGSFTDYAGNRTTFFGADRKQIEEYLAEDFRRYMLADGKVKTEQPVRNGIFQYILDILKKLFDKLSPRDIVLDRQSIKSIHEMFEKLRVGNIGEFSFNEANADFKVLDKGLTATSKDEVEHLSYSESKLIVDTFDAIIGNNASAAGSNPAKLMANPKTAAILYDDVIFPEIERTKKEEVTKRNNIKAEIAVLKAKKAKKDDPKLALKERELSVVEFNLDTLNYVLDHFGDYNNKKEILDGKGAIAYHLKKTRFLLQKEKSDIFDAISDEADIKRSSHTEKGAQKHSLESLASSDVIMMLKTIYKPADKTNRLGYADFEDDRLVWNSIAKVLEGVDGKDKMYGLMLENSDHAINPNNHIFKQLHVLLGNPMEAAINLKHKQFARWEEFKQAFDRLRVALTQVTIDKIITTSANALGNDVDTATFTIHSGETTGRDKNIVRQWENAFKSVPSKYVIPGLEGNNYLDLVSLFNDPLWVGQGKLPRGTEHEFLKAVGIVFTEHELIKKEINGSAKRGHYGVHELYNSLKGRVAKEATSITSLKEVFKDEATRLKHIAELEARYNPTAGFMATTAEGSTQFEHAQQSSATRLVTALNDAANFADVTGQAHMAHLNPYTGIASDPFNFFTRGSRTLDSLFDDNGLGDKREWRNNKVIFEYKNFSGIALTRNTVEHDSGIDAANADETTKLLADMFTFMQLGVSEGARVSDRGTTSLYYTSYVAPVPGTGNIYHSGRFYIDPVKFLRDSDDNSDGIDERRRVMMQYLSNELLRVKYMMSLPSDAVEHNIITPKGKSYAELGKEFVIFQDIIKPKNQDLLKKFKYESLDSTGKMSILYDELRKEDPVLFDKISDDIDAYFEKQYDMFKKKYDTIVVSDTIEESLIEAFDSNSKATYKGQVKKAKNDEKIDAAIDAHIANSWMHMYEGMAMFYGDMAIYGDPDTFIKRITGSTSPGLGFSNDESTKAYYNTLAVNGELNPYTNSKWFAERAKDGYEISPNYDPKSIPTWTGVLRTGIMNESSPVSAYLEKYEKVLYYASKERLKKLGVKEAAKIAKAEVKAYTKMDEADGQGWITFDSYRILKKSMGEWNDVQEKLYQRILRGDNVPTVDVKQFFPVAKYQYFGPLGVEGSSVVAFHKFSLFPLIPTVIKGTELEAMHNRMVEQNMNYNLFHSGSKVATYTNNVDKDGNPIPDAFRKDGKSAFLSADYKFTVNPIFIEYLKDQMAVPDKFKNKVTFSTQLRKIIEVGYMENGVPVDFMVGEDASDRRNAWESMRVMVKDKEDYDKTDAVWRKASKKYRKLSDYRNQITELMELKKHELLRDAGLELDSNGNYKGDIEPLLKMVQNELLNQDMAEHEADYIEIVKATRQLKNDLSFSPSAEKIEKILVALVNRRLINQKVNGEGLVLVSDAGFQKLKKPTKEELAKWGTSGLSFYDIETDANGKVTGKRTRAMKVKVAMKGSFEKLLTHPDVLAKAKEDKISRIDALNILIKDDKWLDQGENRKMITMVGVRIPVQGLNSTEFMEVYEFLPKEAGTILIPPADMVAKSGSDFDIDKLMVMMPNIVGLPEGKRGLANYQEDDIKAMWTRVKNKGIEISEYRTSDGEYLPIQDPMVETLIRALFGDSYQEEYTAKELDEILKAERIKPYEQFRTLFMVKVVENKMLDSMVEMLADPDNFTNLIRPNGTYLVKDFATDMADSVRDYDPNYRVIGDKTDKPSPTRAFELMFNLYKHQAHSVGKQTLGILAVENAMNVLFNSVGAYMSPTFTEKVGKGKNNMYTKEQKIYVAHNSLTVDGETVVSLSHQFDAQGVHNIADVISQLINGAVDVAKDTWIFDIQGNKEVAPTLLFMLQSGIPLKTAIYLVSNPLVREYIKQQKIAKSKFGEVLEQGPSNWRYFRNFARGVITGEPKHGFNWVGGKNNTNFKTIATLTKWDTTLKKLAEKYKMGDTSKKDSSFFDDKLYERIKAKDGKTTEVDRAAFLQFLDIEDMARGTTDVKMKMNFDTKKTTTTFAAMNKQALINELMFGGKFPGSVVKRMVEESPIGSFNIQKFIMELWSPLFKLRNNPAFLRFIHDKTREITFTQDVEGTFGEGQSERFIQQLRNDFAVSIYQNSLKKLDLGKSTFYKGYALDKKLLINLVDIEVGAFVKNNVMYVDDAQIRDDYDTISQKDLSKKDKKDLKGKTPLPDSYKEFGFADIRKGMFANLDEYRNFVVERAYLLSVWELKDVQKRLDYKRYLAVNKKNKVTNAEDAAFQELIKDMAMDNTFNTWKMFKGGNNAAYELQRVKAEYPELMEKYPVLKALIVSQSEAREILTPSTKNDSTFKNIRLLNPNLTGSEISMYHDNLIELGNQDVSKVPNVTDNARLSDFFKRLPYLTLFQSGLDINTMYSLGRLMPYQDLQLLVKKASNDTERVLSNPKSALKLMEMFYMKFLASNSSANYKTKSRYKNYFTTETDENRFETWMSKRKDDDEYDEEYEAYLAQTGQIATPGFISIDSDGNRVYDPKMIKTPEDAKRLALQYPEYLFVFDGMISPKYTKEGDIIGATGQGPKTKINQLFLGNRDIPNKLGVPLRLKPGISNQAKDHPNDKTPKIMEGIDQFLQNLDTDIVMNNLTPVFPKGGLGQALIGAEDITGKRLGALRESTMFNHLSKGLTKYGYKNNNFRFTQKGKKFLTSTSPVTNADIEYQMYVKCRTNK